MVDMSMRCHPRPDSGRVRAKVAIQINRCTQHASLAQAAMPSTGSSGGRPRIMSDAFSAIIIVEL
jgi:hypothetical protein